MPGPAMRATRAIIDLDAIAGNVHALRGALPETTRLMAVVKADGYGHGAPWIAKAAVGAGAALLGVATVGEGLLLRREGLDVPIVLLGSIDPSEVDAARDGGLEVTIGEERLLEAVQASARARPVASPMGVHLKVDTGLRRYGAALEEALALARRIAEEPHLSFNGVLTHFASADEPEEAFTTEQRDRFDTIMRAICDAGIDLPPRHVANSAGIITGQSGDCEIARAGISLYGIPPSDEVALLPGMRPAMRIESRIARVIAIEPGDTVGYNRTFRADRALRGALIPIGYADGYRRSLAGRAWVGMAGRRAPLIGRVSMDQIVAAIPDGIEAHVGDTAHILGDPAAAAPSISDIAAMYGTNSYEVVVGIRQRVPRVFVQGGRVVDVRGAHEGIGDGT